MNTLWRIIAGMIIGPVVINIIIILIYYLFQQSALDDGQALLVVIIPILPGMLLGVCTMCLGRTPKTKLDFILSRLFPLCPQHCDNAVRILGKSMESTSQPTTLVSRAHLSRPRAALKRRPRSWLSLFAMRRRGGRESDLHAPDRKQRRRKQ